LPGAVENQQLLLDEYGLGHHVKRFSERCPKWMRIAKRVVLVVAKS
jgi:hypothetical protein